MTQPHGLDTGMNGVRMSFKAFSRGRDPVSRIQWLIDRKVERNGRVRLPISFPEQASMTSRGCTVTLLKKGVRSPAWGLRLIESCHDMPRVWGKLKIPRPMQEALRSLKNGRISLCQRMMCGYLFLTLSQGAAQTHI